MYNLAIRKCISPPLLAPKLEIFKWKFATPLGIEPGPAEPEADMLPSEPARRAEPNEVVIDKKDRPYFVLSCTIFVWLRAEILVLSTTMLEY